MMQFFDYVYYRTRKLYERFKSERGTSDISAAFVLGTLQGLNVLTLPLLFELVSGITLRELGFEKFQVLFVGALCVWMNYRRYNDDKVFTLRRLWDSEDKSIRKRNGMKVLAYAVASFVLPFGIATINSDIK